MSGDYLALLNDEQKQAVLHEKNPLLILAGAGSGKTRVITTKIAYLIREKGCEPWSILAVTFTNKAAREMAARARHIDERSGGAMLRTFHSFGAWLLRRNADLCGLSSNFVIYDDSDMLSLLATVAQGKSKGELRQLASAIARAKDYFLSPDDPELDVIDFRPEFRRVYGDYEAKLRSIGNVDFGDLIKRPVELLQHNPEIAQAVRRRFRVIMVDEYQDSNVAQFKFLCELCGAGTYLCVVGDDDQSIYRFRGAEVKNILEFPSHFAGTDIIRLERNYRSFAPILDLASSVVTNNKGRLGKTLKAERGKGKAPVLAFLPDQDEEARFCAELITKSCGKKGALFSDWAILYRTNAQSLGFETEFLRRRIPYHVVGSLKFYEREEIKDALALLALLANPRDEVAFRRMINKPARGIGSTTVEKIIQQYYESPGGSQSSRQNNELFTGADSGNEEAAPVYSGILASAGALELSAKAAAGFRSFISAMDGAWSALNAKKTPGTKTVRAKTAVEEEYTVRASQGLAPAVALLINESGLAEYHAKGDEINGGQRLGNLQELVNAASRYQATPEGLAEFLEHIELDRSIEEDQKEKTGSDGENPNQVTLITVHNTKGLEFKKVALTGLEQGIFPHNNKEGDDLEEERRLFYVGVTRAMDELYLTSCEMRRIYGRKDFSGPSLFLCEADKSILRIFGRAPAGFKASAKSPFDTETKKEHYGKIISFEKRTQISSDGLWSKGDRFFHDDFGYGEVTGISESGSGPVIKVCFENGHEKSFLSRYQSGNFVKIRE
ncbi:MAG: ATP-dependent helicase [Treponema sp.]|jgi:DNA helicase-2/ATP-dependent DNA helicase PcrA|nr:ATP-dependent helicase [Treponema sp.]